MNLLESDKCITYLKELGLIEKYDCTEKKIE